MSINSKIIFSRDVSEIQSQIFSTSDILGAFILLRLNELK